MSSENKKRIRVPTEFAEASWGTLFQDLEIELVDSALEQTEENQCDFEITESMLPEKLLCENIKVHGLLSEYFSAGQNFDLVETLCADDKELFNIKIHDYLNLGHFIDAIVVEAYKQEFPVDKIRSFLNSILNYSFQLLHSEKELAPIEISFGGSDVGFAIQVSMTAKNFKIEKDWYRACNFIDACDYQKKSRVVVSALWFKGEDELKNLHFYFRKKQANLKNSKLANLTAVPLLSPAQVPYDPIFEDEDDKVVSGGIDENENAIRINGSRNNSNDVTIIKGSKEDLGAGTMKISGSMTVPQMEQQMLRMRSLMLKMKEQLKTQKPESAGGDGFDQELLSQVARLETKAAKLDEEKRSLNARLQLANRKLLIMDNNIQAREQLGRPSQEQALEQEVELLKQQKIVLESKLAAAAATPAPIPVTVQAAHNPVIELLNKDLATK